MLTSQLIGHDQVQHQHRQYTREPYRLPACKLISAFSSFRILISYFLTYLFTYHRYVSVDSQENCGAAAGRLNSERLEHTPKSPPHSGVPRRGLGGLETLPLAYDLRNKRVRMCQNMAFSAKNTKNFLGRRHRPLPRPFPNGEGNTPFPRLTSSEPEAPRPLPF